LYGDVLHSSSGRVEGQISGGLNVMS